MHRHPTIAVVNKSTVLRQTDLHLMLVAIQYQINYQWQPIWNSGANLLELDEVPPGAWGLIVNDESDVQGALGYHTTTDDGHPLGYVSAMTDMRYGNSVSVTISHEILEMLADPFADEAIQVGKTTFIAYESCDAVEADDLAYTVKGMDVSDFMTPAWFTPGAEGPFDRAGHCDKALQILPGGYTGVWTPQAGWQQDVNDKGGQMNRHPEHRDPGWRWRLRCGHDKEPRGYLSKA